MSAAGSGATVRLFRRSDRDQLAALVDAHVQAVVPGVAVPVNTLLSRLRTAGFRPGDRTEDVLLADVADLARPAIPLPGLTVTRRLGVNGTRFTAVLDGGEVGHVEVADLSGDTGRIVRQLGWADVGNLHVAEEHRRHGIATWLLGQAAEWLRLGHVDRLLDYCAPEEAGYRAFLDRAGFRPLTRTMRNWERPSSTRV